MSKQEPIIKIENLSKQYRLGTIGTGTMSHDINRWWHKVRGKEDPYLKIGEANDRSQVGNSEYVWALKDINFEVQPGEILGIIGKNGAGKSTLLKLLSRVTAPTTGSITCHGRIASLLEVGTGFHPELTGRENVFLNGALLGMSKKEIASKLDEIVDFSGCAKYMDTPVKRYSSGMRVRLGFAVAAFLEPDILVVDEVLAVGDAEFQKKAIGKMQDISRGEGRTVLFVSHNMASIKSLCTRGLVLENGKTAFEGTADESVNYYMSSQTVDFAFNPKTRKGNSSDTYISDIKIKNKTGDVIDTALSGEEISLEFTINNPFNDSFHVGAGFFSQEDEKQFHCSTETINQPFKEENRKVELLIHKWPLSNGNFYLNAYIRRNTELVDYVKECIWLKSEKGDYYNTGMLPSWDKGFYIDYQWK
jgi:lipopolysaccharide transport system ATP-binding protein